MDQENGEFHFISNRKRKFDGYDSSAFFGKKHPFQKAMCGWAQASRCSTGRAAITMSCNRTTTSFLLEAEGRCILFFFAAEIASAAD